MNIISSIWNYAKNIFNDKPLFTMNINMDIIKLFNDKESLPQFTDKVNILQIQYNKEHQKLFDIFRFIFISKEISLRVFDLTTEILKISPWTYDVWVVRRKCLSDIEEINIYNELDYINMITNFYPKIYQVWYHRRLLIDRLNECSQEKELLKIILDKDGKNFHCWSHRIWMIRRFNNIEGEFKFVDKMLESDIKNNSVWNYRFFLVEFINKKNINKKIIEDEIKYAFDKIKINSTNESPFNYIMGLINKYKRKYNEFKELTYGLKILYNKEKENKNNIVFILKILLELYEEVKDKNNFENIIEELVKIDYIRKKYYLWKKKNSSIYI